MTMTPASPGNPYLAPPTTVPAIGGTGSPGPASEFWAATRPGATPAALVAAAAVFLTETLSVLFGEPYALMRKKAGDGYPSFDLFGIHWAPTNPVTWSVPLVLFLAGVFLLLRARREIAALWDAIRSAPASQTADDEVDASLQSTQHSPV